MFTINMNFVIPNPNAFLPFHISLPYILTALIFEAYDEECIVGKGYLCFSQVC